MRKIFTLFITAIITICSVNAQQVYDHTQFMLNNLTLNPAVAGSNNDAISDILVESKLSFRRQWTGVEDAPTTALLTSHGMIKSINSGIGGIVFTDRTGPTQRTGLQLGYSYHITLDEKAKNFLSFGISGSALQYSIDFSDLRFDQGNDNAVLQNDANEFGFDLNAGMLFYGKQYSFGLSAFQLTEYDYDFSESTSVAQNNLTRHILAHGAYEFEISEKFDLEPSLLVKYSSGAPVQFNLGAKGIIKDKFWVGAAYRSDDAISILLGATFKEVFHVGYSYDYTLSDLNNASNGSHEVFIGFDLKPSSKTTTSGPRPVKVL